MVVSGVVIDLGQWEILGAGMDLKESDVLKQWSTSGTVVDLESEWISGAGGGGGQCRISGTEMDSGAEVDLRDRGGSRGQRWILGTELDLSFHCRCPCSSPWPVN